MNSNIIFNIRFLARFVIFALCSYACVFAQFVLAEPLDNKRQSIEEVVISAHPLSAEGLAQPVSVLQGEALVKALEGSIGATIDGVPGVHSQSFGEASSRPIIHGLGGPRVRVMEDRIDTLDVSVTSSDHAVTIEPFIADKVEVLKGASTLLYGSGAIGGVVDVHTGRIPHQAAERALSGRTELRYSDNADQKVGVFRLDGGGDSIAWHVDGFSRDADEYDADGATDLSDEVPGSQLRNHGGAVGLSWVGQEGFVGFAVSSLEAKYGLPGEPEGDGNPTLDLEQVRIDFESGIANPLDWIESVNIRIGINDYEHAEFEPDGEKGTVFENDAWEARLELMHMPIANWLGSVGLQVSDREFSALGEEAFLSPVDTSGHGLFWVLEKQIQNVQLEVGLRADQVEHKPTPFEDLVGCGISVPAGTNDFSTFSVSLGAIVPLSEVVSVDIQTDFASRAPVAEELYSCGAHLATQTFEIGNPDLDEEEAINISASFNVEKDKLSVEVTAYHMDFSDYIYQQEESGLAGQMPAEALPVFRYTQAGARFTGLDFELGAELVRWDQGSLTYKLFFDTVKAKLDGGRGNIPRIPATRYGVGIEWLQGKFSAALDYRYVDRQDDVAEFETATSSYYDLALYLSAKIVDTTTQNAVIFLRGSNLTDQEQRNHTSFVKAFAPNKGRSITGGVRFSF